MLLWQQLFEKYCNKRQSNIKLPSWYFDYLVFLLSSWFYRDPLPLPFLATSVRAQVTASADSLCPQNFCPRAAKLEIQQIFTSNWKNTQCYMGWMPHSHTNKSTFCSISSLHFWHRGILGLPGYRIPPASLQVPHQLLEQSSITSVPRVHLHLPSCGESRGPAHWGFQAECNALPFQGPQLDHLPYNFIFYFFKFLWMNPSFSMYSPSPYSGRVSLEASEYRAG